MAVVPKIPLIAILVAEEHAGKVARDVGSMD